MWIVSRRMVKL